MHFIWGFFLWKVISRIFCFKNVKKYILSVKLNPLCSLFNERARTISFSCTDVIAHARPLFGPNCDDHHRTDDAYRHYKSLFWRPSAVGAKAVANYCSKNLCLLFKYWRYHSVFFPHKTIFCLIIVLSKKINLKNCV